MTPSDLKWLERSDVNSLPSCGFWLLPLRTIADRPVCKDTGARLHFIDDRLETLLAVQHAAGCDKWKLYLADWWVLVLLADTLTLACWA